MAKIGHWIHHAGTDKKRVHSTSLSKENSNLDK